MDPFAHTLVGLTASKAGLERLSPLATPVCLLAANSPDSDIIVRFVSDPWNYLHHHRGITHSIVGVIGLAIIIPALVWAIEHGVARLRRTKPRTNYRGLLLASLLVTATHPLMDWTNNYGVRPFLPWSGQWFYGDLVFIVDPYMWIIAGGGTFLAHSRRRGQIIFWTLVAIALIGLAYVTARSGNRFQGAGIAVAVLVTGTVILALVRFFGVNRGRERIIATAALVLIVAYWSGLAIVQRIAVRNAQAIAVRATAGIDERVNRLAAMPTLANPLRWACVAETDRAIYRFSVKLSDSSQRSPEIVDGYQTDAPEAIERYEKPTGSAAELASIASRDRRAKILLNFARFPMSRVRDESCITSTIVQIADLRYTEPGAGRGSFSLNVPVECASK